MVVKTAFLTVHGGPEQGMTLLLGAKAAGIGRASDNDVIIQSPTVSRHHARVTETQFGFVLRDLDSTNGTIRERSQDSPCLVPAKFRRQNPSGPQPGPYYISTGLDDQCCPGNRLASLCECGIGSPDGSGDGYFFNRWSLGPARGWIRLDWWRSYPLSPKSPRRLAGCRNECRSAWRGCLAGRRANSPSEHRR